MSSVIPKQWKEANISSIYKDGSRSDPENYRPVSNVGCIKNLREINQGGNNETLGD